jgi:uncharacterized repeat protein (TIGR01451 family)
MPRSAFDPHSIVRHLLSGVLITSLLLVGGPATSRAVEPLPYGPYGTVQINGEWVPDGTPVLAFCGGTEAGGGVTETDGSESRYSISVEGDDPETEENDGCTSGQIVSFAVDGWAADQTATWAEGGSEELNLTALRPEPALSVEKATNGLDADAAPGLTIRVGDPVTWTYAVSNAGNVPLSGVAVHDDVLGAITCPQTTLAVNEGMACHAYGTAKPGQYANVATAEGSYESTTVDDADPSHYFGEDARIDVEKATNGVDGDSAPGPFVTAGNPITWTYVVSNTGNVDLRSIALSDSDLGPIACSQTTLSPQGAMTCEAYGMATQGQYGNTATVRGTSPFGLEVSDSDRSHYFGAVPDIAVEKTTNGVEAKSPPGPYILVDDPITWTVVVTNTGNITLTQITVLDDEEGPVGCATDTLGAAEHAECTAVGTADEGQYGNTVTASGLPLVGSAVTATASSHYFGADPQLVMTKLTNGIDVEGPPGPTLWVDKRVAWTYSVRNTGNVTLTQLTLTDDQIGAVSCQATALALDETTVCRADGVTTAGQYTNVGTASARPPGQLASIETSDTSYYFGRTRYPSIRLEKRTNGAMADIAPGVYITAGTPVTWTYEIANTGNSELIDIVLTDDQGTPEDDSDDVTVCTVDLLTSTASTTCTLTDTAAAGQYRNEALVTAETPDETVTDTAASHYYGIEPAIVVEKATLGSDADLPPGPLVASGAPVTWTYRVTNTGNITLTDVTLVDSREGSIPCEDTELGARQGMMCTYQGLAVVGAYSNVVTATGKPPVGAIVASSDPSHYFGADPVIAVDKRTEGPGGVAGDGSYIDVGDPISWTYTVLNTGNVTLTEVLVSDDREGEISCPTSVLLPEESMVCTKQGVARLGYYTNTVTVTAESPLNQTVMAVDTSGYFGAEPEVAIQKRTAGRIAWGRPGPLLLAGSPVTWTYALTNTGNTPLEGVAVIDTPEGAADCPGDRLEPEEGMTCELTGITVAGPYSNTVTLTATAATGRVVTATAASYYFGTAPEIEVEKAVSGDGLVWHDADDEESALELAVDAELWWRITVSNTGNVSLTLTLEDTRYRSPLDLSSVCDPAPPAVLPAQVNYGCTFKDPDGAREGMRLNVVTAQGRSGQSWIGADADVAAYVTSAHRVYLPLVMR